nr:unnamed protein product [Haemonchus contortus]
MACSAANDIVEGIETVLSGTPPRMVGLFLKEHNDIKKEEEEEKKEVKKDEEKTDEEKGEENKDEKKD